MSWKASHRRCAVVGDVTMKTPRWKRRAFTAKFRNKVMGRLFRNQATVAELA